MPGPFVGISGLAMKRDRMKRSLIALVILVLILLPLYLWPLRAGQSGVPAGPRSGWGLYDPRKPSALAELPSDVWDALMGQTGGGPLRPPTPPRNLTMIASTEAGGDAFGLSILPGRESLVEQLQPPLLGERLSALALIGQDAPGATAPGEEATSSPVLFATNPGDAATGPGGALLAFGPGGFGTGLPVLGPFGGIGGGQGGGAIGSGPTDNFPPTPTPEPSTLLLVGSNLAMLGAVAWKRRRRR